MGTLVLMLKHSSKDPWKAVLPSSIPDPGLPKESKTAVVALTERLLPPVFCVYFSFSSFSQASAHFKELLACSLSNFGNIS
uniref:Uncharacterized protein n=1 Tax=Amphimedon queenslandica TaxID=400682 RepID=A0A1X7VBS2_AMPQE